MNTKSAVSQPTSGMILKVVGVLLAIYFLMNWLIFPAEPVCPTGSKALQLATKSVCIVEPLGWR